MLKKIFSFLLILLLGFLFISCYGNPIELTTTNETTTNETTTDITTNTEYIDIEVTNNSKRFYRIDEELDKSSIELTAYYNNNTTEIIQNELFSVRGFDSTKPGRKTIFITFDSYITETEIIILEDYAFEIDMTYYEDAINLKGNLLHVKLNNIINENFIPLLYAQAIEVLENSDQDPDNPDNVIVAYPGDYGISVPTGYSSEIDGYYWNREHVWPQSRLGVGVSYTNDFTSKATDVHNLKPSDPDENSARSNDYFDYFNTNNTYEPRDEVKGDIARILFYMATMYFDLTLNNDIYSESSEKTMGILSVLLEWNELDPVDDFERNRNEEIFSYQGNRNPFIDYPDLAELIWGDLAE
ncbi:MAG: endonuclease I family protein [Bacillota bacterium]